VHEEQFVFGPRTNTEREREIEARIDMMMMMNDIATRKDEGSDHDDEV
jgi:hypothetical protein